MLLSLGCWEQTAERSQRPDVLLLTVDTFRPDYMGMNGYDLPTSPSLDALLGEGWYFEQAITPIARTTPALASLLTGTYPHSTGVRTLSSNLSGDVATLAEVLSLEGYQTVAAVSNHVLGPKRGLDRGFDSYQFDVDLVDAPTMTKMALDAVDGVRPDKPLFLWAHYLDPHIPYLATSEQLQIFDPDYQGDHQNAFRLRDRTAARNVDKAAIESLRGSRIHASRLSDEVEKHVRRLYAASIRSFDDEVGKLVRRLRVRSSGNLIIVFTADHGESLGEHDYFWDHGEYVYNAGLRVPLAFVLPKTHPLHGSGRCSGWVSLLDVVPTLFELLGPRIGESMTEQIEGRSITPCMRGEALPPEPQFAESGQSLFPHLVQKRVRNDFEGRLRSVVMKDWKLVWNPFQTSTREWELYDLSIDPHEKHNFYTPGHIKRSAQYVRSFFYIFNR